MVWTQILNILRGKDITNLVNNKILTKIIVFRGKAEPYLSTVNIEMTLLIIN